MSRRNTMMLGLALIAALVAALCWWQVIRDDDGLADEPARAATMAAAARATTALMTRRGDDPPVRADVAAMLTGRLADEYASQGTDVALPGALARQLTMTARVVGTGIADFGYDRARVLVFVDLWAAPRGAAGEVPRVALARLASMRNVNGTWLLAGLTPVGSAFS